MDFEFFLPTKVVAQEGITNETASYLKEIGAENVLIVTDQGIKNAGILDGIYANLEQAGISYEEYADVKPNPRDTDCETIVEGLKGKSIDGILGIGGGSSLDTAKAVSILYTNGGSIRDYEGMGLVEQSPLPVIAIPTTAGTGSEVTCWSVITDTKRHYKMSVGDFNIAPKVALLDASLTASMPASIAGSTGMDALTHAIEAYTCRVASPITDGLALHAIKLINENLVESVENPQNTEARENMLVASLIAGAAFGNANTASVHCLSEAIGGLYDTPHGIANSVFLPYCFKHNTSSNMKKHVDVAHAMGIVPTLTETEAINQVIGKLFALNERLNIPVFHEIKNVNENDFSDLADKCVANWGNQDNAAMMTHEDYVNILKEAYEAKPFVIEEK